MPDHPILQPEPAPGPAVLSHYPDPGFVARFLAGMHQELAGSFSDRQLFAIQQAFGPWDGKERRRGWFATVRLPWGRYILSVRKIRR